MLNEYREIYICGTHDEYLNDINNNEYNIASYNDVNDDVLMSNDVNDDVLMSNVDEVMWLSNDDE